MATLLQPSHGCRTGWHCHISVRWDFGSNLEVRNFLSVLPTFATAFHCHSGRSASVSTTYSITYSQRWLLSSVNILLFISNIPIHNRFVIDFITGTRGSKDPPLILGKFLTTAHVSSLIEILRMKG